VQRLAQGAKVGDLGGAGKAHGTGHRRAAQRIDARAV
jgi:hypothetical protein